MMLRPRIRPRRSARPGTRAPHLVVTHASEEISLLDLFGRDFVLLAGTEGQGWCEAADAVAAQLGVAVTPYRVGGDGGLGDGADRFETLYRDRPGGSLARAPRRVCGLARVCVRQPCRSGAHGGAVTDSRPLDLRERHAWPLPLSVEDHDGAAAQAAGLHLAVRVCRPFGRERRGDT